MIHTPSRQDEAVQTLAAMRPSARQLIFLFGTAPLLIVFVVWVRRFLRLDSCLDSGGVYDDSSQACTWYVQTLPVGPLVPEWALVASVIALIIAAALALVLRKRGHLGS